MKNRIFIKKKGGKMLMILILFSVPLSWIFHFFISEEIFDHASEIKLGLPHPFPLEKTNQKYRKSDTKKE